jgi:hypothetical protein
MIPKRSKRMIRSVAHYFYADDINLLGYNIGTIKQNTETLIDTKKEVGLGVKVEKTKNMLLSEECSLLGWYAEYDILQSRRRENFKSS